MSTFVIAGLAAVSGALGGLALGALFSRIWGTAFREDLILFACSSVVATSVTIATACLL